MTSYAYNIARQEYVYGNTVKREKPKRQKQKKEIENREKLKRQNKAALVMNAKYVKFLATAAVLSLLVCLGYLKLQSEVTSNSSKIESLQSELLKLKDANNARSGSITSSVNLVEIREKAISEFGMVYPEEGQIIEYESPSGSSVEQYYDIPEDGVVPYLD